MPSKPSFGTDSIRGSIEGTKSRHSATFVVKSPYGDIDSERCRSWRVRPRCQVDGWPHPGGACRTSQSGQTVARGFGNGNAAWRAPEHGDESAGDPRIATDVGADTGVVRTRTLGSAMTRLTVLLGGRVLGTLTARGRSYEPDRQKPDISTLNAGIFLHPMQDYS